ncbi:Major facilitator superfamily domain general substrate transporter [Penicillium riverlandense]|uniref:Major facilitator superfamily domain general substrate transporter n=1 Tax=Penicillium riverlandense TaxID=1903569 RepID=UPI0025495814|nr:Major facilitator superfamily domain general substrate transporter [Penicillium riverlandense]KAJ5818930.1 Major facilitator superfamily domain general substrate transporter [Penicillium riverlandense]
MRQEQQAQQEAQQTQLPETEPGVGVTQVDDADTAGVSIPAPVSTPGPEPHADPKQEKKKAELSPEELAEKKRRRVYRWKIIFGLFFPFALQALDTTIVASALPFIARDFGELKQLNWIISAFNLTSAAFLFFWAQLTDLFGRITTILAATIIMMVGSAICTGAPTSVYGVLLLGRALQGVGAAGVNISIRTILADRVSLRDYALNWTIFSLVASISFSIGPVIGGYLTEASWRWCFAINLPVGVLAIILILLLLRGELLGPQDLPELQGHDLATKHGRFLARLMTIDYGGQLLFLWGFGLLILALTWGGGTFGWSSAAVVAPLVIGAVLAISWVVYEYLMSPGQLMSRLFHFQRAMVPWKLLSQRDIGLLVYINFAVGMSMFAVMYFMDLYFAIVEQQSAGKAGTSLLYFLPGLGAGAYMAMFSSNIWPRQTLPALLLGGTTSAVGMSVMAYAVHAQKNSLVYGMMALIGHGVGMRMNPGSVHGLAFFPKNTASITCLVSFAMPFGGLVGLTVMTTVYTNKSGPSIAGQRDAIKWAFISMIPFMWLGVLLTTFLGNVWISKTGGHEVVHGAYLWSFLTRKKLAREHISHTNDLGQASVAAEKTGDEETGS